MADLDTLMVLAVETVDVSAVSTHPSGDGEPVYTVEADLISRVVEFEIEPSDDIPATSPLEFVFNFRPGPGGSSGGSLTLHITPATFDNMDGMKAEFGYVVRPTQPGGASRGVCYLGTEGATYSLAVIRAHDVAGVEFKVRAVGTRVSE